MVHAHSNIDMTFHSQKLITYKMSSFWNVTAVISQGIRLNIYRLRYVTVYVVLHTPYAEKIDP